MNLTPTTKHNAYTAGGGIGLAVAQVIDARLFPGYTLDPNEIALIALATGWLLSYFARENNEETPQKTY